ncbi:MAG: hypothetical protein EOP83_12980 [Verrucomicrobiaceae bacterium]|nr:MAG: hypothetical protein EOP83_12980 [Verrucomicrobiaceae bacterium]
MPIPPAPVISVGTLGAQATMAHVMALLKVFPSVGQARKNGWDKPITLGDHTLTKKRIRVRLVP